MTAALTERVRRAHTVGANRWGRPRRAALGAALGAFATLALGAGSAFAHHGHGHEAGDHGSSQNELETCFWVGPAVRDNPEFNYAFPDSGAVYWSAQYQLPPGSHLVIRGRFAHSRYQSLTSYDATTKIPTDALTDVDTQPDAGSSNPFLPGARRTVHRRSYTAAVLGDQPPADPALRAANTLYAGVPGQVGQALIYRIYVPDRNQDLTGGVGLPVPELHLADGTVLEGEDLCAATNALPDRLPVSTLPMTTYQALRNQPSRPPTWPAEDPPVFRAVYNTSYSINCNYLGLCGGNPPRAVGQYSNLDIAYGTMYVNRGFGSVLVMRGKLPSVPQTYDRAPRMDEGQLRYWSLCQNESLATTVGAGCVYDQQIPTDSHGRYTIVSSLPADRPDNATERCGVAWVPWPENGDGAGHPDDGLVIVRNMLPSATFHNAVQDTTVPGDEAAVMGDYLPTGEYTTTEEFEDAACGHHGCRNHGRARSRC